jgi:hypothetical protein
LEEYLSRTEKLRPESSPSLVCLYFQKPHLPVCPGTIAIWIKDIMATSGIDIDVFKAHSTCLASTSKAASSNVSLEQILKMADWSRQSTFSKFYYKPVHDSSFASSVLRINSKR